MKRNGSKFEDKGASYYHSNNPVKNPSNQYFTAT